jgi:ribose-phosphate pyrophosphokinase
MNAILFNLFEKNPLADLIKTQLNLERGDFVLRDFPDQETYLRIKTDLKNREIIILDSLDRPNSKFLLLLFFVKLARELGVKKIGLIAPYLSYMRQDIQFNPGECVTSRYFAASLSQHLDWMVTIDPHLHRYKRLSEIYSIPTQVLHASPMIANWMRLNIIKPVLIGPDQESEQWVSDIARDANCPYVILEKTRKSDTQVSIKFTDFEKYQDYTPVLVDDIISTAQTMIETIKNLKKMSMRLPVCIGVHAIFANQAYADLQKIGVSNIVTCNTIPHITNQIDLSKILIESINNSFVKKNF